MRIKLALGVAALTGLAPMTALATNGYFSHGYGTISKGMAGAGTALSQDSMAAAINPAGMAFVGNRIDGGLEVFSPRREYTVAGNPGQGDMFPLAPGTYKSSRNGFVVPHLGFNRELSDTTSFGVSVFANGGMNTDYPGENGGPFNGGSTGVNFAQLSFTPTWSWEFSDNQAIGISPVITYQRFEAEGVQNFAPFSSNAEALSNNGTDDAWGYGYQIGWQGKITDTLCYSESLDVSGMAFYSPAKEVSGPNPLAANQTIELKMHQLGASISVGWKY
ncbi:MAG: outer membrane protein transport protein [Pseudomonadota bacterium]|nr:outer membrane protein transport protein [Pseudomonadota bacterium]